MTSPTQQPAPSAAPGAAPANGPDATAPASTLDGAAKTRGTPGANTDAPRGRGTNGGGDGSKASHGPNGTNGTNGTNGAHGTQRGAQVVQVDSFVRPPAMGARRWSTRPSSGWPAAPAVTLSFGSLTAATAVNRGAPAQPLVQGGMAARWHAAASAEPPRHLARDDTVADVALEDWHDLLGAVMERLRVTVAESMNTLPQPHKQVVHGAARLQSTVLECVLALDQLQSSLAHEFSRRDGLHGDSQAAHAALLRAQSELAQVHGEQRPLHDPAPRDSLAMLPNRGVFSQHLERALACAAPQARTSALLYIDLEGFKAINAAHGRSVGDEVLGVVGARLARAVRADDLVSRVGSDEFTCVIRGPATTAQIAHLASKLVSVVTMPCVLGALQLRVQPSIGVACCPSDGHTAAELLASADAALLRAKRAKSRFALFSQPG